MGQKWKIALCDNFKAFFRSLRQLIKRVFYVFNNMGDIKCLKILIVLPNGFIIKRHLNKVFLMTLEVWDVVMRNNHQFAFYDHLQISGFTIETSKIRYKSISYIFYGMGRWNGTKWPNCTLWLLSQLYCVICPIYLKINHLTNPISKDFILYNLPRNYKETEKFNLVGNIISKVILT